MDGHGELDSLVAILDRVRASEFTLYVEAALLPFLGAVAPYSKLTQHGVRSIVPLDVAAAVPRAGSAVYVTRAGPAALAAVAKAVKAQQGEATIVVAPEVPRSATLLLTQFGVLGDVVLEAWPTALVPDTVDHSILNLFDGDSVLDPAQGVWPLAWALDALQAEASSAVGKVTAVGPTAKRVASILAQRRAEHAVKEQQRAPASLESTPVQFAEHRFGYASQTFIGTEIEHVVLIDRDLDLVTPMLSQTTYAGVLAETVKLTAGGSTQSGPKTVLGSDPIFSSLAPLAFPDACSQLHTTAIDLQNEYRNAHASGETPSIGAMRSIVSKLGSLQATQRLVDTHTELATLAMKDLERSVRRDAYDLQTQILENRLTNTQAVARIQDLVFQAAPLPAVLRLLCLLCLVRGGLKENVLHSLLNGDILKTYGYEHLATIRRLTDRGLIFSPRGSAFSAVPFASLAALAGSAAETEGPQTYSWYASNKAYRLYPVEGAAEAVAYAGAVPLTARIAQMALGLIPLAKTPLEPEFSEEQLVPKDTEAARESKLRRTLLRNGPEHSGSGAPTALVVVVGGVTYAEAAAIKAACGHGPTRNVVVASTSVITGDSLVA